MMLNTVFEFLDRHSSIILTTHHPADADGLGAEKVLSQIIGKKGKEVKIVNSGPVPENFRFLDPSNTIEVWNDVKETLPKEPGLLIVDTADEYNIGDIKEFLPSAREVLVIDHHEPNPFSAFKGLIDSKASSTCELAVELARAADVKITHECALAAYAGIVYDTGFFSYSKTTERTFRAALTLIESGVNPYVVYQELSENGSTGSLLLQKAVLSTMEIHNNGRVAVQVLRKEDLESTGARFEDAENFINIPLKCKDIEVSVLVKENNEGQIRCSLRSKGKINVSKIAQTQGGGGHVSAAGFRSKLGLDETIANILSIISGELGKL